MVILPLFLYNGIEKVVETMICMKNEFFVHYRNDKHYIPFYLLGCYWCKTKKDSDNLTLDYLFQPLLYHLKSKNKYSDLQVIEELTNMQKYCYKPNSNEIYIKIKNAFIRNTKPDLSDFKQLNDYYYLELLKNFVNYQNKTVYLHILYYYYLANLHISTFHFRINYYYQKDTITPILSIGASINRALLSTHVLEHKFISRLLNNACVDEPCITTLSSYMEKIPLPCTAINYYLASDKHDKRVLKRYNRSKPIE